MTLTMTGSGALVPRPDLDAVPVYSSAAAGSVPTIIRASSNEAPFGVAASVRDAVHARLETANRYPQLGAGDLAQAIARDLGASPAEIACADGSLSLLTYLLLSYVRPGQNVVHAWRSYEAYPICVRTAGGRPVGVANRSDGGHDLDTMAGMLDPDTAAIILCSPNNPTGTSLAHDDVAAFLDRVPESVAVVLDEAYVDFSTDPAAVRSFELLQRHRNLVVLRTFSKAYGLAGLRIGFCVAHPDVVSTVTKILPPFPVSALSVSAAIAALDDRAYHDAIVARVVAQRVEVSALLDELGVAHDQTEANFVWLPLGAESRRLGIECSDRGMSTRVFEGEGVRVSLGEEGVVDVLRASLTAFLA